MNQQYLIECLDYCPESGVFIWKTRPHNHFKKWQSANKANGSHANKEAGTLLNGYKVIKIDQKIYYAHRLAWLYISGEWPDQEIDHINHVKIDNRFENLRQVTGSENCRNRGTTQNRVTGVDWMKKSSVWRASLRINGVPTYLGSFTDWFEAVCVRKSANNRYGYHPNHGMV